MIIEIIVIGMVFLYWFILVYIGLYWLAIVGVNTVCGGAVFGRFELCFSQLKLCTRWIYERECQLIERQV
jgi:hypothetical protein